MQQKYSVSGVVTHTYTGIHVHTRTRTFIRKPNLMSDTITQHTFLQQQQHSFACL